MLFRFYREGTIYMRLFEADNRTWTSPYIHVMAVLVVAVKLMYGLDGLPRARPEGLPAAPHWAKWAESALHWLQGPLNPSPYPQVCRRLPHNGSLAVQQVCSAPNATTFVSFTTFSGMSYHVYTMAAWQWSRSSSNASACTLTAEDAQTA